MATANMSLSEQSSSVDIDIHRDELRAGALRVCNDLGKTLSLESSSASKELVSAALKAFADADLNGFSFFNSSSRLMSASDMRRAACVIEALGSESGTLASIYLVNAIMAGSCIAAAGPESQRSELLPRLRAGTIQVAFAMTEPEAGSDAASMTTSAVSDSPGGFQINGEKLFATGAATADRIIVVARTNGDPKRRSFGLFNLCQ
jgi:alkylation response protein AidB-like acyl-CoA dehydrogenase